jgi:hypothetical protein
MFTKRFTQLEKWIESLQSKINKNTSVMHSYLDKRLSKLENKLKENSNDDQVDLLENLTKFLLDKEGLRLYQLKEDSDGNRWFVFPTFYSSSDEPMCELIDIDELKTLGNYTTITVGKQKYCIAKRKVEKKKK